MGTKQLLGVALLSISTTAGAACSQVQLMTPEVITERLTPPGAAVVQVAAQSAALAAAAVSGGPEQVYKTYCFVCHDAGVAGAPKLGDADAWAPRIKKGIDTLLDHVVSGFGAMPAMGTCATCTADDLKETVEYMIEASS